MTKKNEAKLVELLTNQNNYTGARDQFVDCILHHQVDEAFYRKYVDLIPWDAVSFIEDELSEDFVREMRDYLNWNMFGLWGHQPLYSYDFIRQMRDYLNISKIIEAADKLNNGLGDKLRKEFNVV